MKPYKSKGDAFDDIAKDSADAAVLRIKAALFNSILSYIDTHKLTQEEAALRMGVQRSRIGDICRGKIEGFSIDYLVLMVERVGVNPIRLAR